MTTLDQIEAYIAGQPEPKRGDMRALHQMISNLVPDARLWFLDGRNSDGKTVSNPSIGYGVRSIVYADGSTREFYQIGLSANATGISLYILGIDDKTYLKKTFASALGKASVSGYCIRFKRLRDVDGAVLEAAVRQGIALTTGG
jgi:hypothetical protein